MATPSPLHLNTLGDVERNLCAAVSRNDVDVLFVCAEYLRMYEGGVHKRINLIRTDDRQTVLMLAAEKGHEESARALLDLGASVGTKGGVFYLSALAVATRNEHHRVVQLLLDRGARQHVSDVRECVDLAVHVSNAACLRSLLNAISDIDDFETVVTDALDHTIDHGRLGQPASADVIATLCAEPAAQDYLRNNSPSYASALAREDSVDCVRILVDHGLPIRRWSFDDRRATPLMEAAYGGNVDMIHWLLNNGASVHDKCNRRKRTALHYAANPYVLQPQTGGIIEALCERGADPTVCDEDGMSPIDIIRCVGSLSRNRFKRAIMPRLRRRRMHESVATAYRTALVLLRTDERHKWDNDDKSAHRLSVSSLDVAGSLVEVMKRIVPVIDKNDNGAEKTSATTTSSAVETAELINDAWGVAWW